MVNLSIALFDKNIHDHKNFSCGVVNIDNWFKRSIPKQINRDRVRVWCALDDAGALVGFYALSAHTVTLEEAGSLAHPSERYALPTIYLNFIGVDINHQGDGVGGDLLADAIRKCAKVSDIIGVSAIVLDVNVDGNFARRVRFYESYGFEALEGNNQRLILSIQDARLAR